MPIDRDNISICVTLKNRARLLNDKLHQLQSQDYDLKKVEICITDGGSTDGLLNVLEVWAPRFCQIKYAVSDRSVLPFRVLVNPACDYNAQMANQPTFEKLVRTDAEILFTHPRQLRFISDALEDKDCVVWHPSIIVRMAEAFSYDPQNPMFVPTNRPNVDRYRARSAFCIGVNKSTFIANRGFDERYAVGFAGEDNQFLRWYRRNRREAQSPWPVIHQWHEPPADNPEFRRLRDEYTKPLLERMTKENERANPDDEEGAWMRPEMLRNERVIGCC